ncbi:Protein of unknown function DUF506 [Macleaya cordata]|uniref:Uncharacterized protein n=1 Tax=Macleaya cordata TaxID=56857 RepID=A0A200QWS7_MACCD|nr:Protein of unknown function DUF506 [Macleaya cordata]
MGRLTGRIPVGRRILMGFEDEVEFSSGEAVSITDMVLGFFDGEESSESSCSDDGVRRGGDGDDEDGQSGESDNVEERKAFWEAQHQLLHATLTRSSSLESRIRNATKVALKESQLTTTGTICICPRSVAGGCRHCLLRYVSDHLRNAGYDAAVCKSKWKSSQHIPSGEHMYVDVLDKTSSKKGEVMRVVIELNFRAEFEMARANDEYNRLNNRLPEVFIGKAERLRTLIKIMCSAAKKCMKENKMHMGPWRKQKYMEAKWFGTCQRTMFAPILPKGFPNQSSKPRTSMLTFDLVEKLPTLHCKVVEVL